MSRHRALLAASQMSGGGKIVLTNSLVYPRSIFDNLYNKYYDIGGSALNPNPIDEEIYLEGFSDATRLNGKVTRLYVRHEQELWLYTEESVSVWYAAALYVSNDSYCALGTRFTD